MISSPFYTPERINNSKTNVSLPLQVFKEVACSVTTPIVLDGVFFSKSNDGRLACYLESTGDVKWISQTEKLLTSSPLKCEDKLYVIDYENEDVLILDCRNGRQLDNLRECDTTDWIAKKKNIYLNITDSRHEYRKQLYCRDGDTYKTKWIYKGFQFDSYAASDNYIVLKDRNGNNPDFQKDRFLYKASGILSVPIGTLLLTFDRYLIWSELAYLSYFSLLPKR